MSKLGKWRGSHLNNRKYFSNEQFNFIKSSSVFPSSVAAEHSTKKENNFENKVHFQKCYRLLIFRSRMMSNKLIEIPGFVDDVVVLLLVLYSFTYFSPTDYPFPCQFFNVRQPMHLYFPFSCPYIVAKHLQNSFKRSCLNSFFYFTKVHWKVISYLHTSAYFWLLLLRECSHRSLAPQLHNQRGRIFFPVGIPLLGETIESSNL